MPTAKIYTRLSRDEVGQTSTQDQERECRALAARLGISTVEIFPENPGTSGFKDVARPVFDRLMTSLAPGDVVLAWALDRLTRKGMEQAGQILRVLEERGARLVTVSDGIDTALDIGTDLNVGIRAIMAREYSKGISRNVKRGKASGAAAGKWGGGNRWYGYAVDADGGWRGPTRIDETEAKVLHEIRDRYVKGERFLHIAVDLSQRGVPTVQGKEWRAENMGRLVTRKRYAGIREHLGVEYPAAWPAIFTAAEYAELIAAKHRAERVKTWPTGPTGTRTYCLTGFIWCHCGNRMVGNRRGQRKYNHRRYKCRGISNTGEQIGCNNCYRSAEPIEVMVEEAVVYILDTPELAKLLAPGVQDGVQVSDLAAKVDSKHRKLDALVDDYAADLLDRAQFVRAKTTAEAALKAAEADLHAVMIKTSRLTLNAGETVRQAWITRGNDWRRQLLRILGLRVTVLPSGGRGSIKKTDYFMGKYQFRPEDVRIEFDCLNM